MGVPSYPPLLANRRHKVFSSKNNLDVADVEL